jgi:flagellar biosynthesis protein FlhF
MKIKRFVAPDMRTAFALVRQEQGPDAVILSNRMTDDGVEIVAASNYDETLVQRTLEAMRPAEPAPSFARAAPSVSAEPRAAANRQATEMSPAEAAAAYFSRVAAAAPAESREPVEPPVAFTAPAPASVPSFAREIPVEPSAPAAFAVDPMSFAARLAASLPPVPVEVPATAPAPAMPAVAPQPEAVAPVLSVVADNGARARAEDEQLVQMRAELAAMREMIEGEMHRLTDERLRGSPVRAQAMELMDDYGFDAGITRDVALQIPADTELHRGRGLMLGLLSRRLPILPVDPLEQGGVIALVGPTGAGKTTTIAKLAAAYADRHNPRDVALVTTDTVRVGGREQLHSYGRQLGIAVHEADSDVRLAQTLERLRDYKLVLIDNLVGQLNWLRAAGQVHTLLVLPANSHFGDLDEVVRRFSGAQPHGVVLTKVDETGRLGSALSVIVDHQLPMAWITDGQRVPEDLHRASAPNLVLRLDQLRREADEPSHAEAIHVA